jgi:hypothetical protein
MFVLTGPGVLHEGFKAILNLAKAVNFLWCGNKVQDIRSCNLCKFRQFFFYMLMFISSIYAHHSQ